MKIIVLVLAALAIFPLAALAAPGDGSFDAALEGPFTDLMPSAQQKAQKQQPSAAKGPTAPDDAWKKTLEAVKRDGKYKAGLLGLTPDIFSIKDVVGDAKAAHTTQEIQVFGMLNDDGKFEPMGVSIMTRTYTLDSKDGNWHIEWWGVQTDIYGEAGEAGHGTIVESPAGKTVSTAPEKIAVTDPRIKMQFDAMLKYWSERP